MGIDRPTALSLHHTCLATLVRLTWGDGAVTDVERYDLHVVAAFLGVVALVRLSRDDADAALNDAASSPAASTLEPSATRSTRFATDPDSLSGTARKATDYGIPIVTEDAFAGLLDDLAGRTPSR